MMSHGEQLPATRLRGSAQSGPRDFTSATIQRSSPFRSEPPAGDGGCSARACRRRYVAAVAVAGRAPTGHYVRAGLDTTGRSRRSKEFAVPTTSIDYEEIRALVASYAFALDFDDAEAFAECFTENGVFEIVGLPAGHPLARRFEGRDALTEFHTQFRTATQGRLS